MREEKKMQNGEMFNNKKHLINSAKIALRREKKKIMQNRILFLNSLGKLTVAVCRQLFIVITFLVIDSICIRTNSCLIFMDSLS